METIKNQEFIDQTLISRMYFGVFHNELVAIKEQPITWQNQPDSVFIALIREIAILAFCKHSNIAQIFGVYFCPQQLQVLTIHPRYYIDLYQALFGQKQLYIPNKKSIACQLLEALQYIHEAGLLHLDLKPKNIMFKSSSLKKIVLIDFGISKILRENQETNVLAFTYCYCPPEISEEEKSIVSVKSDIFSYGIILYELITGNKAWSGKGGIAVYNLIHNCNLDFFKYNKPTGNKDFDNLIVDCVHYDQNNRITISEALERIKLINFDA